MSWRSPVSVELRVMVTTPPLRGGVLSSSELSRPMLRRFGVAGHEDSLPPNCMTEHWLPMTLIMRFWSHCMMVTEPPWPPKLISVRSRGPLMYTVLSVEWPMTVVRVLILMSADAGTRRQLTTAAESRQRRKRLVTKGLLVRLDHSQKNGNEFRRNSKQSGEEYNCRSWWS